MTYQVIKAGIIKVLSKVKDIDIFFEMNEDVDACEEYYFVKILPVISKKVSKDANEKVYLVDIRYYHKDFNYLKYIVMAENIDEAIKPNIEFEDFWSDTNEVDINISGEEVHIRFKVALTYVVEKEEEGEKMLKLESVLESEEK